MSDVAFEDEYIRVERVGDDVIVVQRTAVSASPAQLNETYVAAMRTVTDGDRGRGVVLDMRLAPGRNDDDFEGSMRPIREALDGFFGRTVMLVSTAVGMLQVRRLASAEAREPLVTQDYDEAIRLARPSTR